MTDAEISRRLALAIGWTEKDDDPYIIQMGTVQNPEIHTYVWHCQEWVLFDYRDPAVIWPIAERFDFFPVQANHYKGRGWIVLPGTIDDVQETAAKAVALAVIKAKEQQ